MSPRVRAFVGSIGMVVFLGVYVWLATFIGGLLPQTPVVTLLFYGVVGTAWGVPLIPLLFWINKGR